MHTFPISTLQYISRQLRFLALFVCAKTSSDSQAPVYRIRIPLDRQPEPVCISLPLSVAAGGCIWFWSGIFSIPALIPAYGISICSFHARWLVKVRRIGISIGKRRYERFLDFYGNGRHVPCVCAFVAWFHYSITPSLNSFARVKLANAGCQDWWYVCRWTRRTHSWERGIFIASTECRIERSTIHSDIKSSIRSDMRPNSATTFVALAMRMPQ